MYMYACMCVYMCLCDDFVPNLVKKEAKEAVDLKVCVFMCGCMHVYVCCGRVSACCARRCRMILCQVWSGKRPRGLWI
jgi:hypothetical protein